MTGSTKFGFKLWYTVCKTVACSFVTKKTVSVGVIWGDSWKAWSEKWNYTWVLKVPLVMSPLWTLSCFLIILCRQLKPSSVFIHECNLQSCDDCDDRWVCWELFQHSVEQQINGCKSYLMSLHCTWCFFVLHHASQCFHTCKIFILPVLWLYYK